MLGAHMCCRDYGVSKTSNANQRKKVSYFLFTTNPIEPVVICPNILDSALPIRMSVAVSSAYLHGVYNMSSSYSVLNLTVVYDILKVNLDSAGVFYHHVIAVDYFFFLFEPTSFVSLHDDFIHVALLIESRVSKRIDRTQLVGHGHLM